LNTSFKVCRNSMELTFSPMIRVDIRFLPIV
jgi:hypothetical protein